MDRQEGKHLSKAEKKPRKGKIALIVILIVVIALAAAYVGLCVYVDRSGKYLPNTIIAGVDVGGLTQVEGTYALDEQLERRLDGVSVEFSCEGTLYTVPLSAFTVDTGAAMQQLISAQYNSSLLTRGAGFLAALAGGSRHSLEAALTEVPSVVEQAMLEHADVESQTTWTVGTEDVTFHKGRTGRTLDTRTLTAALMERAGHLLNDDEPVGYAPVEAELVIAPPAVPDFESIYQELLTKPADAYLDVDTKEIVPSVTGVSFDIPAARSALESTPEGGTCVVPLDLEEPEVTTEKLSSLLFADVLGTSVTSCAGPSNRWYNIDLACSRVNGTILMPGDEFSYNDLAGPYSTAGGYRKAGAYVGGKNIDTTAGGICQLSSTLYWTTLKANLEITERNKHLYNSGYMPVVGTDATVYSDSLDFRFKNNTEYPIKIECYQSSGHKLYVTIYGTDTTGIHGEPYSVTLATVPYKTYYKPDASKVPVGGDPVRDTEYARYNGITIELYQRLVDKDGNVVDEYFMYKNTYKPSDGVYYYNPEDAARLGIDTSTGLKTLTPVTEPTPTPAPSTTPAPSAEPTPSATPTPSASPDPSPSPSEEVSTSTPGTEPPASSTPGTELDTPDASVTPEAPAA